MQQQQFIVWRWQWQMQNDDQPCVCQQQLKSFVCPLARPGVENNGALEWTWICAQKWTKASGECCAKGDEIKWAECWWAPKNDTHRRLPSSLSTSHDIRQTCSSVPSGTTFFSLIFFLSVVIVSFVKSLNIYLRFAVGAFGIVIALTVERICVVWLWLWMAGI